jgi:hypothetical protein
MFTEPTRAQRRKNPPNTDQRNHIDDRDGVEKSTRGQRADNAERVAGR